MRNFIGNRKPLEVALMVWLPAQAVLILMLVTAPVHAATATTDCATDGGSFYCRLLGILHILYAVAAVLGVLLVVIAAFAYAAYRRNRARKLDEMDRR